MTILRFALPLLCLAVLAGAAHATEPPAPDVPGLPEFRAGVAAYRAGDHAAALAAFQDARRRGLDIPNLHVNLGLSFYKLERYDEARVAFEGLRRFPEYRGIADFHLGLVAARLGERERARELWREVERAEPGTGAGELAGVALGRLTAGSAPRVATGYLLAAAGYDSNPALLDESAQLAGGSDSSSLELFGAFDVPVDARDRRVTVLRGGGYLRDYFADNGLDQRGLFAGLGREWIRGGRRRSASLDASATQLDGERFLDTFSAGVGSAPARDAGVAASVQASRVEAATPFRHLEGWRARGEAELGVRTGGARVRTGYQLEYNDRADLESGGEFYSHSPLRHRLSLSLDHAAGERWQLRWTARYRDSRFREPNRFFEAGSLREERRVERLAQAGVQARRRLAAASNLLLEYQYSLNTASIETLEYERHALLVGWEWLPRGP